MHRACVSTIYTAVTVCRLLDDNALSRFQVVQWHRFVGNQGCRCRNRCKIHRIFWVPLHVTDLNSCPYSYLMLKLSVISISWFNFNYFCGFINGIVDFTHCTESSRQSEMSQESARLVSADQGGPQNGGRSKSSNREAAKKTNAGQVSIHPLRCFLGCPMMTHLSFIVFENSF